MFCKFCGYEISSKDEFCANCGKTIYEKKEPRKIYKNELTRLRPVTEQKNPGVAAAIGFFLGWIMLGPVGYIYLGQWNWFWITFVIQIVAYPLTFFVAYLVLPLVFAIHQHQMAKDLNAMLAKQPAEEKPETEESLSTREP